MAKETIATLRHRMADLEGALADAQIAAREAETEARQAKERERIFAEQFRNQADDLKKRLHAAETANQFMRGYLARVQEDDVVREDLLTVGEPDGEQHMVPKRKPTEFQRPEDFTRVQNSDEFGLTYHERKNRKGNARHWITY